MNQTALHLPRRAEKPRDTGLTMVIDGGIPLWYFTDLVSSAAEYIDFVKFGWGTAVVSSDLRAKIKVLSTTDIGWMHISERCAISGCSGHAVRPRLGMLAGS